MRCVQGKRVRREHPEEKCSEVPYLRERLITRDGYGPDDDPAGHP